MPFRKYPEWVVYVPSYEIVTGNDTNFTYFEADYRGIDAIGVEHAMLCFLKHCTKGGCR